MKCRVMVLFFSITLVLISTPLAQPASEDSLSNVDARAIEILRKTSDLLTGTQKFGFRVEETFDEYAESQMLQFANLRSIVVKRPNKVAGESSGDTINRSFWYNGKTFHLLDREYNVYGGGELAGTIDGFLDHITEQFDVVIPLGEMLSANLFETLTANIRSGEYVGLHQVGEVSCHHLAFTQERLDWQLWVEASDTPFPRKIVITYKQEPGMPQYTAVIYRWNLEVDPPDSFFEFVPPEGARQIDWTVPRPESP